MNPRTHSHPTPVPATLSANLLLCVELIASLRNQGHQVQKLRDVRAGERPRIVLEPSPRLAHLAEEGDQATWYQFGTRSGQRFRTGVLYCPGALVTWTEIVEDCAKRRAA